MSAPDYKLSKQILGEEPSKLAILFSLFTFCTKEELEALEWVFPNQMEEWKRREQRPELNETHEEMIRKLGFQQYMEKKK